MGVVLLDTTVVSLFMPGKKAINLRSNYAPHISGHIPALSFQSVAELWKLPEEREWGAKRRDQFESFIKRFLVIPYNYDLAMTWAQVMIASKKQGNRFEAGDCWIAATAVRFGIPLLTHDKDFTRVEIPNLSVICYA
jgi:tRNA(fMet)-specific endonuclease VapC